MRTALVVGGMLAAGGFLGWVVMSNIRDYLLGRWEHTWLEDDPRD